MDLNCSCSLQYRHLEQLAQKVNSSTFKEYYETVCCRVRANDSLSAIMKAFEVYNSDFERVRYVAKMEESKFLTVNAIKSKCSEKSEEFENDYNDYLIDDSEMTNATFIITKSIQYTPPDDAKSLAMRYMKRSWSFMMQEKFELAELDAKRSLEHETAPEMMWNSYEILGHCFAKKSLCKKAEFNFKKALDGLRNGDCTQEMKAAATRRISTVYKTVMGKKDIKKKKKGQESETPELLCPKISYNQHKTFEKASDAIDIGIIEGYGRGFFATRDIRPGDILMVEDPYVAVLNCDHLDTHCFQCFKRLEAPVPCEGCCLAMFCNDDCLHESTMGVHSKECKVLPYLFDENIGGVAAVTYRVLQKITWKKIRELLKNGVISLENTDKQEEGNKMKWAWKGKYSTQDYLTTYHLTTNASKRSFGDLFKRAIAGVYITEILKNTDFFGEDCTQDDFIIAASLVLRHMQGGSCNAYGINEFISEKGSEVQAEVIELGGAIYPTVSLANHSCDPNIFRYSVYDMCVVRAIKSIKKGQQIFDNYGPQSDVMSYDARQSELLNQYKFICSCIACVDDWPLFVNNKVPFRFICPESKCKEIATYIPGGNQSCISCGRTEKFKTLINNAILQFNDFEKAFTHLHSGNYKKAITILQNYRMFLDRYAIQPARCITECQEALKRCFMHEGNKFVTQKLY